MQRVFTQGRALVIGVANYLNVPRLPPTVLADARDVADLLRAPEYCGYAAGAVRTLIDAEASCAAIRRELQALASSTNSDSTVVIFFSGHGGRIASGPDIGNYLLPHDFDVAHAKSTGIGSDELTALLTMITVKRLVVFLDACHSGGTGNLKTHELLPLVKTGLDERVYDRLAEGAGRVIVASSRADEFSYVLPGMANSLFSHHLLGALKGGGQHRQDGLVRVLDVFHHVAEEVPRGKSDQHPILKAHDVENNFPLALLRGGGTSKRGATRDLVSSQAAAAWRELTTILQELYPKGPTDAEIWSRAGGDIALLDLNAHARAAWHAALRKARQGGGGREFQIVRLVNEARDDFPHHVGLKRLSDSIDSLLAGS